MGIELGLLLLFGALGLATFISSDDDEACEGEEVVVGPDDELVETGDCGDLITTDTDSNPVADIFSGGGDDTIVASLSDSEVSGGAGDDLIYVDSYNTTVNGGEGNDTIAAEGEANTLFGDEGDDHITLLAGTENFEAQSVDGGEGDDTIVSEFGIAAVDDLYLRDPIVNVTLSGGDGADQFEFDVLEADFGAHDFEDDFGVGMTINDFEPGEDVLVVDPHDNYETNDATFSHVELQPFDDNSGTYVVFFYDHPELADSKGIAVELVGATGVTLDDIQVVGVPAV